MSQIFVKKSTILGKSATIDGPPNVQQGMGGPCCKQNTIHYYATDISLMYSMIVCIAIQIQMYISQQISYVSTACLPNKCY